MNQMVIAGDADVVAPQARPLRHVAGRVNGPQRADGPGATPAPRVLVAPVQEILPEGLEAGRRR